MKIKVYKKYFAPMLAITLMVITLSSLCFAADVNGTWVVVFTPGQRTTITLQQSGNMVTGEPWNRLTGPGNRS